jgi:hypothetical protein
MYAADVLSMRHSLLFWSIFILALMPALTPRMAAWITKFFIENKVVVEGKSSNMTGFLAECMIYGKSELLRRVFDRPLLLPNGGQGLPGGKYSEKYSHRSLSFRKSSIPWLA